MKVLDLFSGIGGFSLGLERAGMRTVAFCEIESYPRAVLQKHWPDVPIWKDVRGLNATEFRRAGVGPIDVICGGFPCQDISNAGKRAGIEGERSGLWSEIARLVGELRPRFVIVENSAALLGRGLGRVLGDLAEIGYDAEWHCIPASYVGAPHVRDRVWIVANPVQVGICELTKCGVGVYIKRHMAEAEQERNSVTPWSATTGISGGVAGFLRHAERYRADDGVPRGLVRSGIIGNAVVPIIPEIIGRAIMEVGI